MIDFGQAYEAPISLDDERLIGTRARRPTLWMLAAVVLLVPELLAFIASLFAEIRDDFQPWVPTLVMGLLPVAILWCIACYALSQPWGARQAEYWLKAWLRYLRLPKRYNEREIAAYVGLRVDSHYLAGDYPRAVVNVETLNLRMTDADVLASHIKKLHVFLVGLRWPVQIVVRAWAVPGGVERRWYIAVAAETEAILDKRIKDICDGLARAGLGGRPLNGDLYDSLQACWSVKSLGRLGPSVMDKGTRYFKVDGEFVRGFLLKRWPRTIDPNWLAPLLDGELPVDFSMWLDPIPNTEELEFLSERINEWETAQVLNQNRQGYRDPDIDDKIKDAQRTRHYLRRPGALKVFRGSVGFVVRGPTLEVMEERERLLTGHVQEQAGLDALIPLDFEHDKATKLAVPTGEPAIEYPLQIVSPAVALTYPFSNSCLRMTGGPEVGTSLGSKRINTLNLFDLANPHLAIFGTSGAGKGYWVKIFLARMMLQAFIIQTEKDEYTALARSLGGVVLRRDTYDSLENLFYPAGYRAGGAIRNTKRITVFDLTHMDSSEHGRAIARLLKGIKRSVSWTGKPEQAVCVIDELGIILDSDDAARAISHAYRTFRSVPLEGSDDVSRIGMIGITQRPSDLLTRERGKVLADLAETNLFLRHKSTELRVTKNVLGLSADEAHFLETCGPGDAILVAGRMRVGLKVDSTTEEHDFAKT